VFEVGEAVWRTADPVQRRMFILLAT